MFLAPTPQLAGVRRYLSDGIKGVRETVRAMRAAVIAARSDLSVRQAAIGVIWLQPPQNGYAEAAALFEWVRDRVRYVRDIVDVETLSTPGKTLEQLIGDCDDQSTLLAALLESVGYPTRFVVAAYNVPGHFEHVYLQVCIDGEWIDCDPTVQEEFGWSPPGALSLMFEEVAPC